MPDSPRRRQRSRSRSPPRHPAKSGGFRWKERGSSRYNPGDLNETRRGSDRQYPNRSSRPYRDRDYDRGRGWTSEQNRHRDRDRGGNQEREYRRDREGDKEMERDRDRDGDRNQERVYRRDRDGDKEIERDRDRNQEREYRRDRDGGKETERDRDRNQGWEYRRDRDGGKGIEWDRDRGYRRDRDGDKEMDRDRGVERNTLSSSAQPNLAKEEGNDGSNKGKEKKAPRVATSTEGFIKIQVNDRLGTKTTVPCLSSDTIRDLKLLVAARIGREPHEILLKRQGERPFKDFLTLEDYSIKNGMQLDLEVDTGD